MTRDITRRLTYVRHGGDTYVRLAELLSLLDDAGVDEPLAAQIAARLRESVRRATSGVHLVDLVPPRAPWWRS